MSGASDVIELKLAALLIGENLVFLLRLLQLLLTHSVLGEEVIGVGALITDQLLPLCILNFRLFFLLFLVALAGLVTIVFFPLLVY